MAQSNDYMEKFFAENPISKETVDYFKSVSWTNNILSNPAYRPVPTYSRVLKASGEDYFFSNTINTPNTIPHYLTLSLKDYQTVPVTKPSSTPQSLIPNHRQATIAPENPDCLFLMSFGGQGVDGHPGVAHGGIVCALLDETMGLMVMLHHSNVAAEGPRDLFYTINLNVSYKKQVSTPGEILVKTWLVKREQRKWYTKGQIVDKNCVVLAEGDGLWLIIGNKL